MVDGKSATERRKTPRLPVRLPVQCDGAGVDAFTHTVNLTESGIYIEGRQRPPIDAELEICLCLPDGEPPLKLRGRAVRCGRRPEEPTGVSIEFLSIDDVALARLSQFVGSRAAA